ncbi:MAG TPA: RNA polymerase sigma factor [Urbifossiella sp.]|nr:RNA polymerase sigma factor [Urbifossiella sp.]
MPVSAVRVLRAVAGEEPTDAELLGRFADRRDEAAFALLVRRHGAMVYGVCRRMLPEHDAEDAFQAVFLVLAQKARTAALREVANWLYGVARRAALQSRRSITRRRERTGQMPDCPAPEPTPLSALRAALDEELSRLPDIYRTVVVLCDLEGRTRREAAGLIGCPEGTVSGRLSRARELLAKRLARHATAVSVAAVVAATAAARVPAVLPPTATIPPRVAALTRDVLCVMSGGKIMNTTAALILVACAGFGMALRAGQGKADAPATPAPPVEGAAPPAADGSTRWAVTVVFVKAGAAELLKGEASVPADERAVLTAFLTEAFVADPPERDGSRDLAAVFDRGLIDSRVERLRRLGLVTTREPVAVRAVPGKTAAVRLVQPYLDPQPERMAANWGFEVSDRKGGRRIGLTRHYTLDGTPAHGGRAFASVRLDGDRAAVLPWHFNVFGARDLREAFTKAYGGETFVIVRPEQAGPKYPEPADSTAWGDEVGGLQAGLRFKDGKQTYHHGETAKLEVKFRNVGTADVKLTHGLLRESPPRITDAGGERVFVTMPPRLGIIVIPTERVLKPGETVILYTPELAVEGRLIGQTGPAPLVRTPTIRVEPGRFKVVLGGMVHSHTKLATGAAAFEVKAAAAPQAATVWGKEVGGLQAGLGLKGGNKTFRHGETADVVLRVRNVGKEPVEFKHIWAFFVENPPTVTTPDGRTVRFPRVAAEGMQRPRSTTVAPGKDVELYTWKLELRPAKWLGNDGVESLYGTGKFGLRCERVVGPTASVSEHPNPGFDKLATGTLELDVNAAPPEKQKALTPDEAVRVAGPPPTDGATRGAVNAVRQEEPPPPERAAGRGAPTDSAAFLQKLRARDARFDNRSIEVEQCWVETVSPRGILSRQRRDAIRFGQTDPGLPAEIPADFQQPHRLRHLLTIRGAEVTMENLGDREAIKEPRFVSVNSGRRNSSAGGFQRAWSPEANYLFLGDAPGLGDAFHKDLWRLQWPCGIGAARFIDSVESVRADGDQWIVKGQMALRSSYRPDDATRGRDPFELRLDRDLVVRRAWIRFGHDRYEIETRGVLKSPDGAAVAESGTYRLLQGHPEAPTEQFDFAVISVSAPLAADEYTRRIRIDPPPQTEVRDWRSDRRAPWRVK